MARTRRPKLAVRKFASCDGCQLTLLDLEDELLELAAEIEIAYFPEAMRAAVGVPTTYPWSRAPSPQPTMPGASSV